MIGYSSFLWNLFTFLGTFWWFCSSCFCALLLLFVNKIWLQGLGVSSIIPEHLIIYITQTYFWNSYFYIQKLTLKVSISSVKLCYFTRYGGEKSILKKSVHYGYSQYSHFCWKTLPKWLQCAIYLPVTNILRLLCSWSSCHLWSFYKVSWFILLYYLDFLQFFHCSFFCVSFIKSNRGTTLIFN